MFQTTLIHPYLGRWTMGIRLLRGRPCCCSPSVRPRCWRGATPPGQGRTCAGGSGRSVARTGCTARPRPTLRRGRCGSSLPASTRSMRRTPPGSSPGGGGTRPGRRGRRSRARSGESAEGRRGSSRRRLKIENCPPRLQTSPAAQNITNRGRLAKCRLATAGRTFP